MLDTRTAAEEAAAVAAQVEDDPLAPVDGAVDLPAKQAVGALGEPEQPDDRQLRPSRVLTRPSATGTSIRRRRSSRLRPLLRGGDHAEPYLGPGRPLDASRGGLAAHAGDRATVDRR